MTSIQSNTEYEYSSQSLYKWVSNVFLSGIQKMYPAGSLKNRLSETVLLSIYSVSFENGTQYVLYTY